MEGGDEIVLFQAYVVCGSGIERIGRQRWTKGRLLRLQPSGGPAENWLSRRGRERFLRVLKIILFLAAFVVIWFLALVVAASMAEGKPSETAMLIASAIVLVPGIWLGRKIFRRKPSDRTLDANDATAAMTGVAMGHTIPAVAGDLADDVSDTDVDVDFD